MGVGSALSTMEFVNPHTSRESRGLATSYATVSASRPSKLRTASLPLEVEVVGAGSVMNLDTFLTRTYTTALVVVVDGAIVFQRHYDGATDKDVMLGASMSKSALATMVGLAVSDGRMSLDDAVTDLVPELAGTGYDGCQVRHLLTMTSGVRWAEDYRTPGGDGLRLLASTSAEGPGVREFVRTITREDPPGVRWRYCTPDSLALDWVRERATGDDHATALGQLWQALGCETDATIGLDGSAEGGGVALAGVALAATAPDWARLGMLQIDGVWEGHRLLDRDWVEASGRPPLRFMRPGRLTSDITTHAGFGYHWWPLDDAGETVMADGSRGQFTFVDRLRRTVVVKTSHWPYEDWLVDRQLRDLSYLALPEIARSAARQA
jgi:CubicO group peptidase (beta-lactamase class C family)